MKRKAYTLTELLAVVAIIAVLSAILFPVFEQARQASKVSNKTNLRQLAMAAGRYGQDYDERIPIIANGAWRNLRNVHDGDLTQYGEQRTDLWPLILLPYLKQGRETYVDPRRGDVPGIWSGPALASSDPGYQVLGATYRNQSRLPMFAVNYLFLSPMRIPESKMGEEMPTDFMVGESRAFFQALQPARTVFYVPSMIGRLPNGFDDTIGELHTERGFFTATAPGTWPMASDSSSGYILFWNGTDCSGDWCGDITPSTPEQTRSTGFDYMEEVLGGNNVVFLDGHVRFMSDVDLAAGTDYLSATPSGVVNGGGAVITDRSHYLWNLDSNFYNLGG